MTAEQCRDALCAVEHDRHPLRPGCRDYPSPASSTRTTPSAASACADFDVGLLAATYESYPWPTLPDGKSRPRDLAEYVVAKYGLKRDTVSSEGPINTQAGSELAAYLWGVLYALPEARRDAIYPDVRRQIAAIEAEVRADIARTTWPEAYRAVEYARLVAQWHGAIGSGPIEVLDEELGILGQLTRSALSEAPHDQD